MKYFSLKPYDPATDSFLNVLLFLNYILIALVVISFSVEFIRWDFSTYFVRYTFLVICFTVVIAMINKYYHKNKDE